VTSLDLLGSAIADGMITRTWPVRCLSPVRPEVLDSAKPECFPVVWIHRTKAWAPGRCPDRSEFCLEPRLELIIRRVTEILINGRVDLAQLRDEPF
jgi:hypothetical protein